MNSNIRDFIKAIQNANKTATSAYDTAARVTRVEGGTAWVHVEGGVEETPVEMSISCEPGDDVRVRINKGAAYLVGNNTDPPTGNRIINNIKQVIQNVSIDIEELAQKVHDEFVLIGDSRIKKLSEFAKKDDNTIKLSGDPDNTIGIHLTKKDNNVEEISIRPDVLTNALHNIFSAKWKNGYVSLTALGGETGDDAQAAIALGDDARAEGYNSQAFGGGSVLSSQAAYGYAANVGKAYGYASFAENYGISYATGGHSEGGVTGRSSVAYADDSHSENGAEARGTRSHAENNSIAGGYHSHAENESYALASNTHTEGYDNSALAPISHIEGFGNILASMMSTGRVTSTMKYRSTTVTLSSNKYSYPIQNKVVAVYSAASETKEYTYTAGTGVSINLNNMVPYAAIKVYINNELISNIYYTYSNSRIDFDDLTIESGSTIKIEYLKYTKQYTFNQSREELEGGGYADYLNIGSGFEEGSLYIFTLILGDIGYSPNGLHAEGYHNSLNGSYGSHIEGCENTVFSSIYGTHTEGYQNKVYGGYSNHVEGQSNKDQSTAYANHIEGLNNVGKSGYAIHIEGNNNSVNSSGYANHVEGYKNTFNAGGVRGSHIEGYENSLTGNNLSAGVHVSGYGNIADRQYYNGAFITGSYNDPTQNDILEIGNGTSDSDRSNAFSVDKDGFLQTGYGTPTKIAFGLVNSKFGYYDSNGTFVPWVTQDTTYTGSTHIDISAQNVISAVDLAPLVNGLIPAQYLPSYVDDVIEGYYYNGSFYEDDQYQTLITPERGKIYISLDTDKSYRWSGTVFVELTSGGVVYSAGFGIDISATNEISADNTIARMTDLSGYLPLAGGTMTGAINSQNIIPATDDSYRLGSSTSKYNSAYIKRIYNLASIESTTDGSKRLLVPAKSGTIAVNEDLPEVVGNLISVTPILESGTLIANITVSGVSTNLYAPSGGSSYTAGDGIDISNNEISVDDTIARVSDIPDELADLFDDSTHRLVTDTEKSTWNGKQGALTAGTGIALSSANTISIKYYGAHAEAASGGANNNKREGMADSGDGMFLTGSYNDPNAPYVYGNIINLNGGGTGQLFLGWRGDSNTGTLYYRSHRDNASAAWGPWKQIAYTSDIPSIPSVGNGTLTIQKNGTNVQTFTANQSGNATANIVVPFDYGVEIDDDSSDEGFKGAPHYGIFGEDSSVGQLVGSDGVYMFLPYGEDSNNYGFALACDDSSNKFYLGALNGTAGSSINWSRIYHDSYHPLAGKADFIKFPRNAVDYNTAMRSRAAETVAFDELSGTTGKPSYISTFTNPWFNLITMHSADSNYGSQLAIPMTGFTAPAWRYFAGNNFGSWEYIPSADALSVGSSSTPVYLENGKLKAGSALPDVSTKVSKSGDTMTGSLLVNSNSGEQVVRVQSTRSGVTRDIGMMVGNGSRNEGLWSYSKGAWILYNDPDGNAFFNGSLKVTNASSHSASIRLDSDAIDFDPDSGSSINIDAGGTGSISMTGYIKLVNSSYTSADTRASYSGRINPSSTVNTYIKIGIDKWALVFLSSTTTSFCALRLLREYSGGLQSINVASNGTSIVTITYDSTYGIQLKNTNSSSYIHYAIFMISR